VVVNVELKRRGIDRVGYGPRTLLALADDQQKPRPRALSPVAA
jgi:hypothetical protein